MQPTDLGLVGFRVLTKEREDREEDERGNKPKREGLVVDVQSAKLHLFRLMITLSSIVAIALAGGASVKGW